MAFVFKNVAASTEIESQHTNQKDAIISTEAIFRYQKNTFAFSLIISAYLRFFNLASIHAMKSK